MDARRRHLLVAVATAGLHAACGSGGDGADPPAAADAAYLPLADGNRWVYTDGSSLQVSRAIATNATAPWVLVDTTTAGSTGQYAQSDAAGVRFSAPPGGTAGYPGYTQTVLRTPVVAGDRYPSLRLVWAVNDADLNGTLDDVESRIDAEVVAFATVDTPAGRFTDAVHLRFAKTLEVVYQPSGRRELRTSGTVDEWYVPGIGLVKQTTVETTAQGVDTRDRQLTGYRVGTRTGGVLR